MRGGRGAAAAAGVDVAIIILTLCYYSQSSRIKGAEDEELVIILVRASSLSPYQSSAV